MQADVALLVVAGFLLRFGRLGDLVGLLGDVGALRLVRREAVEHGAGVGRRFVLADVVPSRSPSC
jgi:hypothetical protein